MSSNKTLHELCDELGVTRRVIQGYEKAGLASATGQEQVYSSESDNRE